MSETLDLRGVMCPLNFVRAKLALEGIEEGGELEILLDDGEPVQNVPRSLTDDGNEVLALAREDESGVWRLKVRKASL